MSRKNTAQPADTEDQKECDDTAGKPRKMAEKTEHTKNQSPANSEYTDGKYRIKYKKYWGPLAQPGMSAALPIPYH